MVSMDAYSSFMLTLTGYITTIIIFHCYILKASKMYMQRCIEMLFNSLTIPNNIKITSHCCAQMLKEGGYKAELPQIMDSSCTLS